MGYLGEEIRKVDLLAFGPHPDDVELNVGGILALHAQKSVVVVVDLTKGELSSNGTVELRQIETGDATRVLNLSDRANLSLPDGGLNPHDTDQQKIVVKAIRTYRPRVVLLPYWEDRHPDHVAASQLIEVALFKSGLKLYQIDNLEPYRPASWYYYLQHHNKIPDLVVDVTSVYSIKEEGIRAYRSQFTTGTGFQTVLNQPVFLQKTRARDQYFGGMIGVEYGEGLVVKNPLPIKDLFQI